MQTTPQLLPHRTEVQVVGKDGDGEHALRSTVAHPVAHEGVVCNGRRIRGPIEKAQIMQQLIAEQGSFHTYPRTLDALPWKERRKTLSEALRYFGATGIYLFLCSTGEEVPPWEQRAQ